MSNWASIVKNVHRKKHSPFAELSVQYNIVNENAKMGGYIPRHREVTPDPADNFIMTNKENYRAYSFYEDEDGCIKWIDYTTNKYLKSWKESLPISVQRIIEIAQKLRTNQFKNIDLDLKEIETDIKYQCIKHQNNKRKLKKIYHNYKVGIRYHYGWILKPDEFDVRYRMVFGDNLFTVIHYIFHQIDDQIELKSTDLPQRLKIINQLLSIIRLLMIHNIFNVSTIIAPYAPDNIGDKIKSIMSKFDHYHIDISTELTELALITFNQCKKHNMNDSILQVCGNRYGMNRCNNFHSPESFHDRGNIPYWKMRYNTVEILLQNGVSPFRFVKKPVPPETSIKNTELYEHIKHLVSSYDANRHFGLDKTWNKMALFAPLILKPQLERIFIDVISQNLFDNDYVESQPLSKEIANIIICYSSINSYQFYDEYDPENILDMKCMVFLNKLLYFRIDDDFISDFKSQHCDRKFMDHLIKNSHFFEIFQDLVFDNIARNKQLDLSLKLLSEFIMVLHDEFPLKILYYILGRIFTYHLGPKSDIIQFFQIIKAAYHGKFDINHVYTYHDTYKVYKYRTLTARLSNIGTHVNSRNPLQSYHIDTLDAVLSVFNEELDISNPCLFKICFKNTIFEPLECLLNNYHQGFDIEKICEMMIDVIEIYVSKGTNWNYRYWPHLCLYTVSQNREFLKKIVKYCLEHKCSTDKQRELLMKTTRKVWNCYSKGNVNIGNF